MRVPTDADISLLWSASSTRPDARTVAQATANADIGAVLEAASVQRVAPLVLRSLAIAGVRVDPSTTEAPVQAAAWQAHAHLALPAAARLALEPLCDAGFEPLLMKGLGLVERYPALGLRPMDDIDLLLPRNARRPAASVLERAGWRRVQHLGVNDPGYDLAFTHPSAPGVPLELHYDFAEWRERPAALAGDALWAARVPTTVFGQPAWMLPPELEIIALITHAAKWYHLFNRLLWIVDLEVVAATSAVDWDEVARIAGAARRRVATAVALRLVRRLGADVPDALVRLPRVISASRAIEDVLDPASPFLQAARPRWNVYLFVDGAREKLRFALGDLVQPPTGLSRRRVASELAGIVARAATVAARSARTRRSR